ncbi:hypothetical protein L1049_002547 [Liquidambar formosana]|uniref:Uncharacterized protein n=1 Tax=Liquidambar formosana TaxID=63359 RepID=A0AAP0R9C0_LIQFO
MGSRPKIPMMSSLRKRRSRRRRRSNSSQKRAYPIRCRGGRSFVTGGGDQCGVSDKLQALKNLIPAQHDNGEIKADRLFQETADYILLLRTQVGVLQRLIQFYGSSENNDNAVL